MYYIMKIVRFADKKTYLLDDEMKGEIKKQLIGRWNVQFEKDYKFVNDSNVNELNETMVYLNSFGHSYFLYFTKLNGKECCVFYNKWKDQAYYVRFRVSEHIFFDTLFEGELVRASEGDWRYYIHDIIAHEGDDMRYHDLDTRLQHIKKFLNTEYVEDLRFQPCPLLLAQYVPLKHLDWLCTVFQPTLPFRCNGINFKGQEYGPHYLFIFEKYREKSKQKVKNDSIVNNSPVPDGLSSSPKHETLSVPKQMEAVLALKMTDKPGVYELYANDGDDMLVQIGYAYIRDVEHTQQIKQMIEDTIEEYELELEEGEYPEIPFRCQYNTDFKRWMPIEVTEDDVDLQSALI